MISILRNISSVFAGGVIGSIVNLGLIIIGSKVVPPPEGMNIMDAESIKANIHLFELKHYLFPFLAHDGGTLAGAFIASIISASKHLIFAMVIGVFFLIGGIANTYMIPAPMWYNILDISLCYIPMSWLGWKISGK